MISTSKLVFEIKIFQILKTTTNNVGNNRIETYDDDEARQTATKSNRNRTLVILEKFVSDLKKNEKFETRLFKPLLFTKW